MLGEVTMIPSGGTLAVFLGCHALAKGYSAEIYTYNLNIFDPTWFVKPGIDIKERLRSQCEVKDNPKLRLASEGYHRFLEMGGALRLEVLSRGLVRRYLQHELPILTGLSSTFLYGEERQIPGTNTDHDLLGEPEGHFVVLCGYDPQRKYLRVADPYAKNPIAPQRHIYELPIDRVINSILLGIASYDCNLLILRPPEPPTHR